MKWTLLSLSPIAMIIVGVGCASNSEGLTASETTGSTANGATSSGGAGNTGGSPTSGGPGRTPSAGSGVVSDEGRESRESSSGGTSSAGGAAVSGGSGSGPVSGGSGSGPVSGGSGSGPVSGGSTSSGGAPSGKEIGMREIEARGFPFDVLEATADGEPVLLLHGFPETSLMWKDLMLELSESGYHCLAPDQRGYSPGARPTEVDAYRYEELVADAFALAHELGDRFHLIGHDWGANVGWLMLEESPSRIASFTAMSIPHYAVWAKSVYEDDEMRWYLDLLEIWMTPGEGEDYWTEEAMRNMWTAKPTDQLEQTIAHMLEPGAMTAALNWYRASDGHRRVIDEFDIWEVNVPTLLIHGSDDVGERALSDTEALMTGPYRVVRPEGGHFIVDEQPEVVADETLTHLMGHPIQGAQ